MRTFAIAGLQLDLARANNLARISDEVRAVKKRLPWIDMAVLGELSAYGTATDDAQPRQGPAELEFCRMARENSVWLIPGSIFERAGARICNTTPVINPGGEVVARYHKMFPFFPYEQGVTPGDTFCVFDVPEVGRFGISICYDIWFPEVSRTLAWMGAEVIINPSLTNTIDRDVELSIVRATAAQNQCYVFNVNVAGTLGFGRSIVCGPGGEVLHECGVGREVFALEFDLAYVKRVRERGWNGLGQVLKSFRDNTVSFPPYQQGARSPALETLGALERPQAGTAKADGDKQNESQKTHLRIAKT